MAARIKNRALAAMSGGVDSSVAALLLTEQGYDAVGVMMKLFENETVGEPINADCVALAGRNDAERVARALDIPFYVYNYAERFGERVIGLFAAEYARGRTPNPCVECNRWLKFGALLEKADELRCEFITTGHYARVERDTNGRWLLKRAADPAKDQSYVLYTLTQEVLSRVLFPIGGMTKEEVRELARARGLINARRHDSQDVCFIPGGDYGAFLDRHAGGPAEPGDFLDADGNVLGRHRGVRNYTIGQRRGLGISSSARLYVTAIDAGRNTVTLGADGGLYRKTLTARDINLIAAERIDGAARFNVKIRYAHKPRSATVRQVGADELYIEFDEPQRAVTPGQSAVVYDGDVVVGGGVITIDN